MSDMNCIVTAANLNWNSIFMHSVKPHESVQLAMRCIVSCRFCLFLINIFHILSNNRDTFHFSCMRAAFLEKTLFLHPVTDSTCMLHWPNVKILNNNRKEELKGKSFWEQKAGEKQGWPLACLRSLWFSHTRESICWDVHCFPKEGNQYLHGQSTWNYFVCFPFIEFQCKIHHRHLLKPVKPTLFPKRNATSQDLRFFWWRVYSELKF